MKGLKFFFFIGPLYQIWYEKIESEVKIALSHHMRALESPKVHENIFLLTSGDLRWPRMTVKIISC